MTASSPPDILILGVGNILLCDEGVGIRAVEHLEHRYVFPAQIELVDGGTSGMELLPALEGRTHVFIVDAVHNKDLPPGGVISVDLSQSPGYFRHRISPHQLGLSEVLAVAEISETLPPSITLLGIRPECLDTGLSLSPTVQNGLEEVIDTLVNSLHELGLPPLPRNQEQSA
ncbi:MAG: HyaD/HybD family hydrogenase maturation endopeptidase [Desulfovermiculus sp.]